MSRDRLGMRVVVCLLVSFLAGGAARLAWAQPVSGYDQQLAQVLSDALAASPETVGVRIDSVISRQDGTVVLSGTIADEGQRTAVRTLGEEGLRQSIGDDRIVWPYDNSPALDVSQLVVGPADDATGEDGFPPTPATQSPSSPTQELPESAGICGVAPACCPQPVRHCRRHCRRRCRGCCHVSVACSWIAPNADSIPAQKPGDSPPPPPARDDLDELFEDIPPAPTFTRPFKLDARSIAAAALDLPRAESAPLSGELQQAAYRANASMTMGQATGADGAYAEGYHAYWRREYAAAHELLNRATAAAPQDAAAWYYQGLAEHALGNNRQAARSLGQAVLLDVTQHRGDRGLAQALTRVQGRLRAELHQAKREVELSLLKERSKKTARDRITMRP